MAKVKTQMVLVRGLPVSAVKKMKKAAGVAGFTFNNYVVEVLTDYANNKMAK